MNEYRQPGSWIFQCAATYLSFTLHLVFPRTISDRVDCILSKCVYCTGLKGGLRVALFKAPEPEQETASAEPSNPPCTSGLPWPERWVSGHDKDCNTSEGVHSRLYSRVMLASSCATSSDCGTLCRHKSQNQRSTLNVLLENCVQNEIILT